MSFYHYLLPRVIGTVSNRTACEIGLVFARVQVGPICAQRARVKKCFGAVHISISGAKPKARVSWGQENLRARGLHLAI